MDIRHFSLRPEAAEFDPEYESLPKITVDLRPCNNQTKRKLEAADECRILNATEPNWSEWKWLTNTIKFRKDDHPTRLLYEQYILPELPGGKKQYHKAHFRRVRVTIIR